MNDSINITEPASNITVLYIEDNAANIQLMRDIFAEFLPYELICSSNAQDGIKVAKEQLPQLILMDINMTGMDGYQALD